jgi:ferredoxin-type protein NapH
MLKITPYLGIIVIIISIGGIFYPKLGYLIPPAFRSMWLRVPIFIAMMGFMVFRIIQIQGVVDKVGMVFVTLCILTTSVAILFGVAIAPRAWCSFCPMGTLQRSLGGSKYQLQVDKEKCIECKVCQKVCPMQLPVNEITEKPDCIKCARCVQFRMIL